MNWQSFKATRRMAYTRCKCAIISINWMCEQNWKSISYSANCIVNSRGEYYTRFESVQWLKYFATSIYLKQLKQQTHFVTTLTTMKMITLRFVWSFPDLYLLVCLFAVFIQRACKYVICGTNVLCMLFSIVHIPNQAHRRNHQLSRWEREERKFRQWQKDSDSLRVNNIQNKRKS